MSSGEPLRILSFANQVCEYCFSSKEQERAELAVLCVATKAFQLLYVLAQVAAVMIL